MSRILSIFFIILAVSSCGLLPSYKGPNYELLTRLRAKKEDKLSDQEKRELRAQWKKEVGLKESFALGRYEVTAYPLTPEYRRLMELDLPQGASCFYVLLKVRSAYRKKAFLPHWEAKAKDHEGRFYRLSWLPESYTRSPVSEAIPGTSSGEKLWHQTGTMCTHGKVAFDRYFEMQLQVKKLSFPFYGTRARFVWNVPTIQKTPEGKEVKTQREEKVERYRGW